MLQPGTQVGRYEVQRRLGRGGMGTVYVAHDPVLGRMVAIKVFLSDLDLPDASERFTREARSAAALNHPNIVTIHDFGEFSSQPYIVMEYVSGETLTQIIRRKAPMPLADKLRWLEDLSAGVAYAHRMGLIHRDIKPTNLMVDRSGRLKVLDFGIARILGTLASNATALIGTPGYMAPEQILGGQIDYRSDLFSIGVVSYELLSYTDAFPGDTMPTITHRILNNDPVPLGQLVPGLGPDLVATVERALKKNVDDRFPDVESFRLAIAQLRQQIGEEPEWPSQPTTIRTGPPSAGSKIGTGSMRLASADGVAVAQMTPPPPPDPSRTSKEEITRRRVAKIAAAIAQARALFEQGSLDAALDSCVQAFEVDENHAEALELEKTIQAALAKRRADSLMGEAREQLGMGALTGAQDLLQQARALDPEAPDLKLLERDLRLARVEQERQRQRVNALNKAIEAAKQAIERGAVEAALASAREALDLEPASSAAKAIEAEALRLLDEETGADKVTRAPVTSSGDASVALDPTIIAPLRRTPPPAPLPNAEPKKAQAAAPAAAKPKAAPAPGRPAKNVFAPVTAAIASTRKTIAARPKREKQIIAAAAAAVVLLAIGIAVAVSTTRTVPTGSVLIDAVPWAGVASIDAEDGSHPALPANAATPLSITLPQGTYKIHLVGPPPDGQTRIVTVQVTAGGVAKSSVEQFTEMTPEQYFEQYLQTAAPPVEPAAADPASNPDRPAADVAAPGTTGVVPAGGRGAGQ